MFLIICKYLASERAVRKSRQQLGGSSCATSNRHPSTPWLCGCRLTVDCLSCILYHFYDVPSIIYHVVFSTIYSYVRHYNYNNGKCDPEVAPEARGQFVRNVQPPAVHPLQPETRLLRIHSLVIYVSCIIFLLFVIICNW